MIERDGVTKLLFGEIWGLVTLFELFLFCKEAGVDLNDFLLPKINVFSISWSLFRYGSPFNLKIRQCIV